MVGVYFLLFAMVCGIATFIEHYYSTAMAKVAVYETLWFEILLAIAALSLCYNIIVFKLYRKDKLAVGLFHFAFVLMIMGAGITRHWGQDGQIHLRKGEQVSYFLSQNNQQTQSINLPFKLELKDFKIEYYPGSKSPSEYRSHVYINEGAITKVKGDVYMNHILKYKGYRFFQSSYDTDLQGSILSVNHDPWGMEVSYAGYALMFLGMLLSLFAKGSRFQALNKKLNTKTVTAFAIMALCITQQQAQAETLSPSTTKAFSEMLVSNGKGRLHPMNTINLELTKKLTHEKSFMGYNADAFILNILVFPERWKEEAIIHIDHDEIKSKLGINSEYISYTGFFENNNYKLYDDLELAYNTPPEKQSKYQKKVISITDKVGIFKMILEGSFLKIYPDAPLWQNPLNVNESNAALQTINSNLATAIISQNNNKLNHIFEDIASYQAKTSTHPLPSVAKIKIELIYNKINLFTRLAPGYATLAILLFIIGLINLTKNQKLKKTWRILHCTLIALFTLHTAALIMRWYISGHAPMSNGYESMLLVAWASILGGLYFAKKSPITLAISTILASATLLVAYINSMNPEITPLVPVLNSNWLSVHVATITTSYALLGICALLGLFNLSMLAFAKEKTKTTVRELTTVSQLLMIVGLYLLTIGCFIGAVWANESWGRYWSWDPKETWCLITIVLYAFVIHMHHIPKLSSSFAYNSAALWSLSSILMTYFGVNYFLGGMHSYGKADGTSIGIGYYFIIFILLIINIKGFLSKKTTKK